MEMRIENGMETVMISGVRAQELSRYVAKRMFSAIEQHGI